MNTKLLIFVYTIPSSKNPTAETRSGKSAIHIHSGYNIPYNILWFIILLNEFSFLEKWH
jgi:hypothetical protein